MSREALPFAASDMSALARSLGRELEAAGPGPSHVQLLNMLARGAGYRNYQHLRAQHRARERLEAPPGEPVDYRKVERVARHFGAGGRFIRWPSSTGLQRLCLWVLWSRLPRDEVFSEIGISRWLGAQHGFGDHALLRREMVENGLLSRTDDCREYRRVGARPPPEAAALIRRVAAMAQPEKAA